MGVPYVTKVSSSINMSQAESLTEVTDAFQKAVFNIDEDAKTRGLEVAWGSGRLMEEEPNGYASIIDSGPWIVFDAIGRRA